VISNRTATALQSRTLAVFEMHGRRSRPCGLFGCSFASEFADAEIPCRCRATAAERLSSHVLATRRRGRVSTVSRGESGQLLERELRVNCPGAMLRPIIAPRFRIVLAAAERIDQRSSRFQ